MVLTADATWVAAAEVERQGVVWAGFERGYGNRSRRVAHGEEAADASAFRFEGVDRKRGVVSTAGVGDMAGAAANGTVQPGVDEVEDERSLHGDRRMQAAGRLPGAKADACNELALSSSGVQGNAATVACEDVTWIGQTTELDLYSFHGGVDVAGNASAARFLSEDVPRFDRLPNFEGDVVDGPFADHRKAEFELRSEPSLVEVESGCVQFAQDRGEVGLDEVGEQKAVVQ